LNYKGKFLPSPIHESSGLFEPLYSKNFLHRKPIKPDILCNEEKKKKHLQWQMLCHCEYLIIAKNHCELEVLLLQLILLNISEVAK